MRIPNYTLHQKILVNVCSDADYSLRGVKKPVGVDSRQKSN
jgi:hypothetical protein